MIRSTAISWKIGLIAAVLLSGQFQALADEGRAEKSARQRQPIEPRKVRVILMPPADEALFALRPPPVATEPTAGRVIMVQPAGNAALAPSRPKPTTIQENAEADDAPSSPDRPAQVASLPPADDSATTAPRRQPEEIRKDAKSVEIPSLPERAPFRTVLRNRETGAKAFATSLEQAPGQSPEKAKSNSAFGFLSNLWPGKKRPSEPVAPTAEDKPRPTARAASVNDGTEGPSAAGQTSGQPAAEGERKSLLDKLQFWKR